MADAPLHGEMLAVFDRMPTQLQAAARWALDNPQDVALLTVREQAKRAGVVPATMTRLAQRLGFGGYDAVRDLYAENLRRRASSVFSPKAAALVARRKLTGEASLAHDLIDTLLHQMAGLSSTESLGQLAAAVDAIAKARRIFVLGQRSCYPVAFHFAYVFGLAGGQTRLLDAPGGTGSDALRDAQKDDALLAISVKPYTRTTVEVTRHAARRERRRDHRQRRFAARARSVRYHPGSDRELVVLPHGDAGLCGRRDAGRASSRCRRGDVDRGPRDRRADAVAVDTRALDRGARSRRHR
jgi:DNA-binding MurR/RpiR family transcriptional regulator